MDVDGVLTDGTLLIGSEGEVAKPFNARDGVAIQLLRIHGIEAGVVSGRGSPPLDNRMRQLGVTIAETGQQDKAAALERILERLQLSESQVAYIGDDVLDLSIGARVAIFLAPADAHPLVLERAVTLTTPGGRGVLREAAEFILQSAGISMHQAYERLLQSSNAKEVRQ